MMSGVESRGQHGVLVANFVIILMHLRSRRVALALIQQPISIPQPLISSLNTSIGRTSWTMGYLSCTRFSAKGGDSDIHPAAVSVREEEEEEEEVFHHGADEIEEDRQRGDDTRSQGRESRISFSTNGEPPVTQGSVKLARLSVATTTRSSMMFSRTSRVLGTHQPLLIRLMRIAHPCCSLYMSDSRSLTPQVTDISSSRIELSKCSPYHVAI